MMRPVVLHLIDSLSEGGSERQAVQLAKLLNKSGRYVVRIACLSTEGPLRNEVVDTFGEIRSYPLKCFYDVNAVRQLRRFVRYLRSERVDIVHTHDFYTNIFGMTAAAIARVPTRIASRRESSKRSAQHRRVERLAYRAAHKIVANCEHVRRELINEGVKPNKVVTLYNGVDLRRVGIDIAASRELVFRRFNLRDDGCRVVVIVANLREVKDHRTFLRAASHLSSLRKDLTFVLAGDGPLKDSLRAFALSCGLGGSVTFLGHCDRVGELLKLADVCVLSSRSEGFANSILEYMAASRPVVATDVGGVREAMVDGESGYLVAPGDDQAMAARILSLLDDPRRAREIGERGRAIVEQRFSAEVQLERAEQLYDSLLAIASRPSRLSEEELAQEAQ